MRSLEQRARARLGEVVQGFELDWVEVTDVLSSGFSGRGTEQMASIYILHPRWAMMPGFSSGFSRAAWLSQTIEHSIVPRIIDSGVTDDSLPYVALEFVGGETLEAYLDRRAGTIPPVEALRIGAALADGLAALEERGAVHGAVQPCSVALMDNGAVRLLYTGWTRLRQQAAAHLGSSSIPGLSGYLSPTQARGEVPTPRDDLWSLSAIVFELLTGTRLRSGETDEERLIQARHPDVGAVETLFRNAPQGIGELMLRAFSPNEALRINSAAEFAAKCRSLAQFPEILGLRRLNGPTASAHHSHNLGPAERPTEPNRASANAPSNSGVSALNLPLTSATGTNEFRPSHMPSMLHGNAGAYSSHGSERVETLFPKKR